MFGKLKRNKKGGDKIISIYWFVIIAIISGAVIIMAYNFYGSPYDVRDVEAGILSDKIADCISQNGLVDNLFLDGQSANLLEVCNLNFNSPDAGRNEFQYFAEVFFYNISDIENPVFEIKAGNLNLVSQCEIKDTSGKDYTRLVKCDEKRFYSVGGEGKQYLVKIISGVKKNEKNVQA